MQQFLYSKVCTLNFFSASSTDNNLAASFTLHHSDHLYFLSVSLQDFDDFIFAFFAIEMVIKMVALGIFGKKCYLGDTWNRLDFFIVLAG